MNAIRATGDCDHAGGETATTRTAVSVNAFCRALMSPLLERRAHREVERAEVLAGLAVRVDPVVDADRPERRSEEHTSELQSRLHLVCRLLLEKKKNNKHYTHIAKDD